MSLLDKIADNSRQGSLSHQFRRRRFAFFQSLIDTLPRPVSILDIGGTTDFWEQMAFNDAEVQITLLNLQAMPVSSPRYTSVAGDATRLEGYADQSFDIVFSNSVIEHLFSFENQQKMAAEVQRVGRHHFVQTPNYWFPLEPHWLFPFFQYLPFGIKKWITMHFRCGHIQKLPNGQQAARQVKEVRLLTGSEMKQLFPDSAIYREKIGPLTKSFVAYHFGTSLPSPPGVSQGVLIL